VPGSRTSPPTPACWRRSSTRSPCGRRRPRPAANLYLSGIKKRLDIALVERGLAATRSQAQALVLAGLVPGYDKPGTQVDELAELHVDRPPRFVSRGGEKLAHALEALAVAVSGRDCLDVGASTGGFTDCLLQAGAARVVALDVGYGQLHPRLRSDPRVTVLERTNVRGLADLPFAPGLVVCDVSFVSVTVALPPALLLAEPGWEAVVLVKPQFEAGRSEAPKGVVRSAEVHRETLRRVAETVPGWGGAVVGVVDSGLPGPKGNREFFLHLVNRTDVTPAADLARWIDDAVG
jgi:23S rRNA (cytidine1920-2'-O)/16S rRNA (cytidine1409-2'-O)-methyltransferase